MNDGGGRHRMSSYLFVPRLELKLTLWLFVFVPGQMMSKPTEVSARPCMAAKV